MTARRSAPLSLISSARAANGARMRRCWKTIAYLISLWPKVVPERIFAAARSHTFRELAEAIDTAFARRDRAHLYQFVLADGKRIGRLEFDDFNQGFIDGDRTRLSTLTLGEQFLYEFDFGMAGCICAQWARRPDLDRTALNVVFGDGGGPSATACANQYNRRSACSSGRSACMGGRTGCLCCQKCRWPSTTTLMGPCSMCACARPRTAATDRARL
jgi:hypothetical protein